MTWTGPLSPNSTTTTTLHGTAESIYHQILALNPSYDLLSFPDNDPATLSTPSLHRRDGQVICSYINTIKYWGNECGEGYGYLRNLGGGNALCTTPAHSCARVSCSWGCGMFLCSKVNQEIRVLCRDVAADMYRIYMDCRDFDAKDNVIAAGRIEFAGHTTRLEAQRC
ncbi:hypothetical protein OQA88_5850 [Cercophora sp. LCS_1]